MWYNSTGTPPQGSIFWVSMSAWNQTWFCSHTEHKKQKNMEGLQPNPLVDMMVEELEVLHHQLTYNAENLWDLICPEWSNALEILNELVAVEVHCLNQQWYSVYARIDDNNAGYLPGKSKCICVITLSSWLTIKHYHCNRICCGQSSVALMLLTLNLR